MHLILCSGPRYSASFDLLRRVDDDVAASGAFNHDFVPILA